MADTKSPLSLFFFFIFISSSTISHSIQTPNSLKNSSFPLSFKLSSSKPSPLISSLSSNPGRRSPSPYNYRSRFKYSMALIVSLPIGTPPQAQEMALDTGSQLSWIQCHNVKKKQQQQPPATETTTFDPALSSSFSVLPCTHPVCKPRLPDFTLPTMCDNNRLCHYSYFYADGTYAEGNLVREKFTFSSIQTTPPLILGCATKSDPGQTLDEGILGMNLGRLSFASQAKITRFSYCIPTRPVRSQTGPFPTGSLYLGENPNSHSFQYVDLLSYGQLQRMPNFDPLAYTVGLAGIRIGPKRLNIPGSVFRPDAGGSGQTFMDSGTEFTFLVDEAYEKVREEVVGLVGPRMKKGYVYEGTLEMCFEGDPMEIGRLVGDMALVFDKGVEVVVDKQRVLADVGSGVHCVGIGRSGLLGVASNIIGNFHQQNLWVEYDLANRRVGFGRADCSRS